MENFIIIILILAIVTLCIIIFNVLDRLKEIEHYIKYDHVNFYKDGLRDELVLDEKKKSPEEQDKEYWKNKIIDLVHELEMD